MPDKTKYAIVLPDGAADEPVESLGGRTPLEAADISNMDWIARNGRIGTVRTVPDGYVPGSDVATMSLLGYDVREHYTGRAPIEAVARNIRLHPEDVVFRCNMVNISNGRMSDFTAGHISTDESRRIIDDFNLQLGAPGRVFHTGVSYRNLLVLRDPTAMDVSCMPPHDIPGEPIAGYLPKGQSSAAIREIMDKAEAFLAAHEVNLRRKDAGRPPATNIWLWGQGVVPILERFRQRFGVRGAVIAAVDLIRGLGKLLGWPIIEVPGATGYIDTDYAAKGRHACDALDEYDLIAVHIEAPDEAGHMGDAVEKVNALERIDEHVVGPLLKKLRTFDRWRILVAPDHPTPVGRRTHTAAPPPFCMAGSDIPCGVAVSAFHEKQAAASDLHISPGHELMEFFLKS